MDFHYMLKELWFRKRRTLTATIGLAVGMAVLITMNSLSSAYSEASRRPLAEIGADITVQRAGNVPEDLSGPVFACSTVTIQKDETEQIKALPGIKGFARALLLWVFDPDRFTIVLGFDPSNPVGPGVLRTQVIDGGFLQKGEKQALVEASYAKNFNIKTGDIVRVNGRTYPVAGILDASRATKIAVANVYLPMEEVQTMAFSSKQVQTVSPFDKEDANILFIKAVPGQIEPLTQAIKKIVGEKGSVASSASFLKRLGSLFALSDKFSSVTSLIAVIVTLLIVLKTMAGNVTERSTEIGVLKAMGWSNRNVVSQLVGESMLQCLAGGILGLLFAVLAAWALGFVEVRIPIPWEMSPFPHFLPGGGDPIFRTLRLPVQVSWQLGFFAILLSSLIGALTGGLLSRHVARIKPSEVLRHE